MIYRTLHTDILRELLRVFLLTATALTTLLAFGGTFRPFIKQGIEIRQLLIIMLNLMPAMLAYAIPIAALFAAVLVYWRMSTDNELTACRAGGISFISIVLPAFMLGLAVASVDMVFVNYVVPRFLQSTERAVLRDLGSLIVSQIGRQEKFQYGNLVVSADSAELLPSHKPDESVVLLRGMAGSWLEQGKPKSTVVGQEATLTIHNLPAEGSAELDFQVVNATGFDPANSLRTVTGSLAAGSMNSFLPDGKPLRVPSYFRNKPKFLNWRDLFTLYRDPYLFNEVAEWINRIETANNYGQVTQNMRDWWLAASHRGRDSVRFNQTAQDAAGGDSTVTLYATDAAIDLHKSPEQSLTFKGTGPSGQVKVEQRVKGKLTTTYTCQGADLVLMTDQFVQGGMNAGLELHGNIQRENHEQGLKPVAVDAPVIIPGLLLDPKVVYLPQLSNDQNDAARAGLLSMAVNSPQPVLHDLGRRAADRIQQLNQTITSELHSRMSFSLSCLTLVLLGAALGIQLRGKNPLAVFVVGFVPAIVLLLLITAGRQMTEGRQEHERIGLVLIWAGNGLLLLLVAGVYGSFYGGDMRILDRYILKSFLVNYLLALCVLVGMYVLLDLIVNVQDFAKDAFVVSTAATQAASASAWDVVGDMFDFYFYQFPVIFQQVSGVIPTLAAGFTMVRMTRHHELTAMLASGVSLYRVAAPIIIVSMLLAGLTVLNQEYLISQPFIVAKLLRKHDEVNQVITRNEPLLFMKDSDGSLLSAREYDPVKKEMADVFIVYRDPSGMPIRHKFAKSARWEIPPGGTSEAWVMRNVAEEDDAGPQNAINRAAFTTPMEINSTSLTPEQLDLILSKKAVDYLSSSQVRKLAEYSPDINKPLLYKIMHLRFTQPLMNIVMLLIGIPFLLTREPNRLIINMFYCTAVSGFVFVATFVIFQMGTQLDPLLAAWLPVLIFGPFALVIMDLIRT